MKINIKLKNKKGDVPVMILVLGVFVICTLTLISLYISGDKFKGGFSSIDVLENATSIENQIRFYENIGYSSDQIKDILGIEINGNYYVIKNELKQGNELSFSVSYKIPIK